MERRRPLEKAGGGGQDSPRANRWTRRTGTFSLVVAARLFERAFAVHDAGAALAAQTLDLFRIDLCHHQLALLAGLDVGDNFWFDVRGDVLLILFGLWLVYARRALGARHTDALELGDGRRRRVAHVLGARFLAARIEHRATFDDRVGHLLA